VAGILARIAVRVADCSAVPDACRSATLTANTPLVPLRLTGILARAAEAAANAPLVSELDLLLLQQVGQAL
jgi:hypothetical protein